MVEGINSCVGEDMKTLAREVRASFQFPQCRYKLDPMEAPYHAPLAQTLSVDEGLCLQVDLPLPARI